jgi:myo-inositol 2-dehydrogenase/D-chiro-inositol 1-dehydrogenase/scyllo-inositol 2-dehydrogenase (NAD+)
VADPVDEQRQLVCRDFGVEREYRDPLAMAADSGLDAVVIATPTAHHCDIAIAAAGAGKHVLCEKPMAMTVPQCRQMIAAADEAGVTLQIGFMRRFDRGFQRGWERARSGEIGAVVQVKSLTHGPSVPKPWMYDMTESNGPLAEVNSHDIDTIRWFAGSEVTRVFAMAGNYRCPDARESHPDFYDTVTLLAQLENGTQGVVFGAQGVRYGYDARCEVLGECGLITIGDLAELPVATFAADGMNVPVVRSWSDLFRDAYLAEDIDFVRCIIEQRAPRATGADGLEALRVVLAGNRSIAERRPVNLEEVC